MTWASATTGHTGLFQRWGTAFLLHLAPALALGACAMLGEPPDRRWLAIAAGAVLFVGVVIGWFARERPAASAISLLPAAIAAIALPFAVADFKARAIYALVEGMLVLIAMAAFAGQTLQATGATRLRFALSMARRLQHKSSWPPNLNACRTLPEVRDLRDAIREEAEPVMPLLSDPRVQVRIAALGALEGRRNWRTGQPDLILQMVKTTKEPEVRIAALLALSQVNQRLLVESMAESLVDPDPMVRRAACEAVLGDCEGRWHWARAAVREALADPRLSTDGPLAVPGGRLSPAAVSDLTAWAMEAGALGARSTQTLMVYYNRKLDESADSTLLEQLRGLVANLKASTVLRVELAHLLKRNGQLTPDLMLKLIESNNPSPLRLMAVEAILEHGADDRAIEVLRDVARQPNRELALSAAVVVQKHLHVDLGLIVGEPPPPLSSRHASEVTRRVIAWAKQSAIEPVASSATSEW